MEKIVFNPSVLENVKKHAKGQANSTTDGIEMLGLKNTQEQNYKFAGNTYLDALREIKYLMEKLGIDKDRV